MSKICPGKQFLLFWSHTRGAKNRRITVSMFLSTLQSTALLLKSFRLRFHCYTLLNAFSSWLDKSTWQVITCQVIWRGARGQGDKSTCRVNLPSWLVCQVELATASWICHLRKKFAGVSRQIFLRIASTSEKLFARFFQSFFCVF